MLVTKCVIRFASHSAVVSVHDHGVITVFKYCEDTHACEYESFDIDQQFEASDYIMENLCPYRYYVNIEGETPLHLE
jgi:hypothetical protein